MSELTKKYLTEINQSYAKLYDGVSCDFSPDEIDSKIEHIGRQGVTLNTKPYGLCQKDGVIRFKFPNEG